MSTLGGGKAGGGSVPPASGGGGQSPATGGGQGSAPGGGGQSPATGAPLDAVARLRAALASATGPGGIGCHHWTRPALGVPVEQLVVLKLVKTIDTKIPTCETHGCAIIATCARRIDFAEALAGRSRRKFKLTPLGTSALADSVVLAEQIAGQPLARRILDLLTDAGGTLSWPDLYWRLLTPELSDLDASGARPTPPVSRPAVRFALDLLVAGGLVAEDALAGTVRRV